MSREKLTEEEKKQQRKIYYQNNKERRKIYNENNKERRKIYYKNNCEKIRKQEKEYRQRNAEIIKQRKKLYCKNNVEKLLIKQAKSRAKRKNLPFDICDKDIIIPTICPILCIPIESGIGKGVVQPNSPSLDRIIPEKGYVKGNIIVISNRANTLKNNATVEEMIKLGEFAKKLLQETKSDEEQKA